MRRVQFSFDKTIEEGPKRDREEDDVVTTNKKVRLEAPTTGSSSVNAIPSTGIPSESELVAAKLRRKEMRERETLFSADRTNIDESTTLASDGISVEPFHMRNEETDGSGFFDGDTYVFRQARSKDVDEEPDAWADELPSFRDLKGKVTSRTQTLSVKKNDDELALEGSSKETLYKTMLTLLEGKETVTRALIRYGQLAKTASGQSAKLALVKLTGIANALLSRGDVEVYQYTKSTLTKNIPKSTSGGDENAAKETFWEYKGSHDGQIHGPYSSVEMLTWRKAGYFVGNQRVLVRKVEKKYDEDPATQGELLSDLLEGSDSKQAENGEKDGEPSSWIWSDSIEFNDLKG